LAEGVNAGVCPGGGARLDEVGDRDRGQHTDDTHHDHYLQKRKARFFRRPNFHTTISFVLERREQGNRRIIYDYFFRSPIAGYQPLVQKFSRPNARVPIRRTVMVPTLKNVPNQGDLSN
jgi:hypothetical protein